MDYDITIIGGGIAGLYSAYKIRKMSPKTRVLLLERSNRRDLGGRASNVPFHGLSVVTGAGIGRKKKDKLLLSLMRELELPIHEFVTGHHFPEGLKDVCDVKSTFMALRKEYKTQSDKRGENIHTTFKEFARSVLGDVLYNQFVTCAGYTDYEKEDVYDTLFHYGFDDNYQDWVGFSVPWKKLCDSMVLKIGSENLSLNSNVKSIDSIENSGFSISFEKSRYINKITTQKVVVATDVTGAIQLVPGEKSDKNSLYKQIHGQPFLRLYGKFSKESIPIMKKYASDLMVVPGPIQKIIPMSPDRGVYMISYSDNQRTLALRKYLENNPQNREHLCRLLEKSLGIPKDAGSLEMTDILDFYWPIGTHYYEPLQEPFKTRGEFIKKAQNPFKNMVVVGEMIAQNQGWVEGALDSVEAVVSNKWILS
jgi:hypothetical protein